MIHTIIYQLDTTDPLPRHSILTRASRGRQWFCITTRCCCRSSVLRVDKVPVAFAEVVQAEHEALGRAHMDEANRRFRADLRELLRPKKPRRRKASAGAA